MKNFLLFTSAIFSASIFAQIDVGAVIRAKDIKSGSFAIGSIQQSILTLSQFQAENGDCWKLMDGSSLASTDLGVLTGMTNSPDARGNFLRMANNGRVDGNQNPNNNNLGEFQSDAFQAHRHNWHLGQGGGPTNPFGTIYGANVASYNYNTLQNNVGEAIASTQGTPRTSAETRPKNITVNFFIKINRSCNFN